MGRAAPSVIAGRCSTDRTCFAARQGPSEQEGGPGLVLRALTLPRRAAKYAWAPRRSHVQMDETLCSRCDVLSTRQHQRLTVNHSKADTVAIGGQRIAARVSTCSACRWAHMQ